MDGVRHAKPDEDIDDLGACDRQGDKEEFRVAPRTGREEDMVGRQVKPESGMRARSEQHERARMS